MEKKIGHLHINMSINNAVASLPNGMEVELHNTIFDYSKSDDIINKAKAFEYLQKILYADFAKDRIYDQFMNIFTEDKDTMIVYAGGLSTLDDDYIIIAFHRNWNNQVSVYAFETYNEGDIFEMWQADDEEE